MKGLQPNDLIRSLMSLYRPDRRPGEAAMANYSQQRDRPKVLPITFLAKILPKFISRLSMLNQRCMSCIRKAAQGRQVLLASSCSPRQPHAVLLRIVRCSASSPESITSPTNPYSERHGRLLCI